jgi:diaminohydroxyphosphoribosylaminopyrimidine deaminase / 5-amino-6-(5-phosphoribosylamino)uracil reductase
MAHSDDYFMQQALTLAQQGVYTTMPNPRVGSVVVRDGVIVGRGAHLRAGEPHAEVHALREAGDLAKGADVYVTLEPCSHQGRTPPCADALIAAGVKRVIVAMQDPNPKVAGNGLAKLAAAGIEVTSGLMEQAARALNPGFISRMTRGTPYVRSKIAASLDGRIALANGVSKWITGEAARQDVQAWRARSCAIMTGVCTVLLDDPQMQVRREDLVALLAGRQPLRVVVDSRLRTPLNATILQGGDTLVAYAEDPEGKVSMLEAAGISTICLPNASGRVDLQRLLQHLATLEINEVLVEAGPGLNGALQEASLIDAYLFYYAPVLMGNDARGMLAMPGFTDISQRITLDVQEVSTIGEDIRIQATIRR